MSTVLIIGLGDMGERLAAALADDDGVHHLVLASRSRETVDAAAASIGSASDCVVEPVQLDATSLDAVADLLVRVRPDLVVQCASLRGPWALAGRDDPVAQGVVAAGLALRLPYQLPVVMNVMRAAQAAGYAGPIANLSFPDVTGPILRSLGLAPTVGLGNVAMILLRVRAALRALAPDGDLPLIRVLGQHSQIFPVMQALEPADPAVRCRVYLGDEGRRDDAIAYRAPAMQPGARYNPVTTASALPLLRALLPGASALRWSTAAPAGLPGGYPVRIADGSVALDLPDGVGLDEAMAFNEQMGRGDGLERIDADGTVHFTARCREAVAAFAPDLAEPLALDEMAARAARLDAVLV